MDGVRPELPLPSNATSTSSDGATMRTRATTIAASLFAIVSGCADTAPTAASVHLLDHQSPLQAYGAIIRVTNVTDLYNKVSDPTNVGATIVLARGTYNLDPTRLPTGRLELQTDMSLMGEGNNPDSVIIDASALTANSYIRPDGQATGAIRVGRGRNVISWLMVRNATLGVSAIEADFQSAVPSRVRLEHLIIHGNRRGIDLRSFGPGSAGRVLIAEIFDNEIRDNILQMGQGIRMVNQAGATGAVISVTMARNNVHHNRFGCLAANNNVTSATVTVVSTSDQFNNNGIGCGVSAGIAIDSVTNYNTVSFSAFGSTFRDNIGTLPAGSPPQAGVVIEGGARSAVATASFNTVSVFLQNPVFFNNGPFDVRTWAARSTTGAPAGSNNVASVVIGGAPSAIEDHKASEPPPPGSNIVSVVKY